MPLTYDTSNCHPIVREELAGITERIIFITMNTRHGWELNKNTMPVFIRRFNLLNKTWRYLCMADTTHMRQTHDRIWLDKFGLQWIGDEYPHLVLTEDSVQTYWFGLKTNCGQDTDAKWNKNFLENQYRESFDQSPFYLRYRTIEQVKDIYNELCIQAD